MYLTLYLTLSSWDKKARPKNSQWAQGPGPLELTGFEDSFRQKHHLRRRKRRLRSGSAVGGRTRGSAVTNYEPARQHGHSVHYGPNLGPRPGGSRDGGRVGAQKPAPRRRPGATREEEAREVKRVGVVAVVDVDAAEAAAGGARGPRACASAAPASRSSAPAAAIDAGAAHVVAADALAPSASSTSKATMTSPRARACRRPRAAPQRPGTSGRPTPLASAASSGRRLLDAAAAASPQREEELREAQRAVAVPVERGEAPPAVLEPMTGARAATACAASLPGRPAWRARAGVARLRAEPRRGRVLDARPGLAQGLLAVSRSTSRSGSRATKAGPRAARPARAAPGTAAARARRGSGSRGPCGPRAAGRSGARRR